MKAEDLMPYHVYLLERDSTIIGHILVTKINDNEIKYRDIPGGNKYSSSIQDFDDVFTIVEDISEKNQILETDDTKFIKDSLNTLQRCIYLLSEQLQFLMDSYLNNRFHSGTLNEKYHRMLQGISKHHIELSNTLDAKYKKVVE